MLRKYALICLLISSSVYLSGCLGRDPASDITSNDSSTIPAESIGAPSTNGGGNNSSPYVNIPVDGQVNQAVDFYSDGSLVNPDELPSDAYGIVKLFSWRGRRYATHDMLAIIQNTAALIKSLHPSGERMQIGDIANHYGGQAGGHASHQNGLDVDIAYFRVDKKEQDLNVNGFAINFVNNGVVSSNFDVERNWRLVDEFVQTGRVSRMFVDIAIKKRLCQYADDHGLSVSHAETLRRLRPWDLHYDHVHLRITCPWNSHNCTPQAAPPAGTGCDEVMAAVTASDIQALMDADGDYEVAP